MVQYGNTNRDELKTAPQVPQSFLDKVHDSSPRLLQEGDITPASKTTYHAPYETPIPPQKVQLCA